MFRDQQLVQRWYQNSEVIYTFALLLTQHLSVTPPYKKSLSDHAGTHGQSCIYGRVKTRLNASTMHINITVKRDKSKSNFQKTENQIDLGAVMCGGVIFDAMAHHGSI